MTQQADLCQYPLPSGRTCRQIALRQEIFCRHHRRLFKQSEAETAHDEAMERLAAKLNSLAFPDLLRVLYGKLTRLRSTVRACPEAQLALAITLQRVAGEAGEHQADPLSTPIDFPENLMESMNCHSLEFLKTLQNQ